MKVPRSGVWQAPQANFLLPDTVVVQARPRPLARAAEPHPDEFAVQPGGVVRFSPRDAGRRVLVRYQFAPRRVALLGADAAAEGPQWEPPFYQALAKELASRGCVVVPAKEVADAVAAAELGAVTADAPPQAEKLARLAQRVNAAYVLLPHVSIWSFTRGTTVDLETGSRRERVGTTHPRNPFEDSPTVALPVVEHGYAGDARLVVTEGTTGAVASDQTRSDRRTYLLGRPSGANEELARGLAREVVTAWRERAE